MPPLNESAQSLFYTSGCPAVRVHRPERILEAGPTGAGFFATLRLTVLPRAGGAVAPRKRSF